MRTIVLAVGRLRPPYADDVQHYQKLLARHTRLELVELRYSGLPLGAVGLSGLMPRAVQGIDRRLVAAWPTMFAYQLIGRLRLTMERLGQQAA